jgi:hypothetical protein
VVVERVNQKKKKKESKENSTQLRPEFKNATMEDVKNEFNDIDQQAIKQETVDFNYVPVRGWTAKGNSIYEAQVIIDKLESSGAINQAGTLDIERLGHNKPLRVKYQSRNRKTRPDIKALDVPFFNTRAPIQARRFISSDSQLNYTLNPVDTSGILDMRGTFNNRLYNPSSVNTDYFYDGKTDIRKRFKTTPPAGPKFQNLQSSVGLGQNVFDGDNLS